VIRRIVVGVALLGSALAGTLPRTAAVAADAPDPKSFLPAEIVGSWEKLDADGRPDGDKRVTITRTDALGEQVAGQLGKVRFGLDDGTFSDWVGKYRTPPKKGTAAVVEFERTPTAEEMGDVAPLAARQAIAGRADVETRLKWKLVVKAEQRRTVGDVLAGTFDQGKILVEQVKDFDKGTFSAKYSWQSADKPRKVAYARARNPVVFVPGIAASELREVGAVLEVRWLSANVVFNTLAPLSLEPGVEHPEIIASDVLRANLAEGYGELLKALAGAGYKPYDFGAESVDRSRLPPDGCDIAQRAERPLLFVYPYDWRRSNVESAEGLARYIGCVRRFYPDSKVDIVAHSMGGLVARRYLVAHPDNPVDKLVTIGSPLLGAPKAIFTMLTGDFGVPQLIALHSTMRDLARFFRGAQELLPSSYYFQAAPESPFATVKDGVTRNFTYDEFVAWMDTNIDPRSSPGSVNNEFHVEQGQDDWRKDSSGVTFLHIVGTQGSSSTITRVEMTAVTRCGPVRTGVDGGPRTRVCRPGTDAVARFSNGDGTVPIVSAARGAPVGAGPNAKIDFNAPGATVKAVGGDRAAHTALPRHLEVQKLVLDALNDR
jgi:pimeloyl-ACP methyl ester carboxylesterase